MLKVCKISLLKRKKNFKHPTNKKNNSKSVSINLMTYGKLLNYSDYLVNLVDP